MNQINDGQPPVPPSGGPAGQQPVIEPGPFELQPEVPPAAAYQETPRRVKKWMILVGVGVLLLALGFVVTRSGTGGVSYQRVSFTTEGLEQNPVKISGLLIKPAGQSTGKLPGVVFANGFTGCKEWYVQFTRQMAKDGLVVLSLDLRGHGSSGGWSTFGRDETSDMIAAANYLKSNVPEVDAAHITAMGHSLGGITATRTGIVQTNHTFSSVVAIWCWTSWKDAITDLTGPIDGLVGRSWLFTTFSRKLDINSPDSDAPFRFVDMVSDNVPPNYMLAIGSADELVSVEREEELMGRATMGARAAVAQTQVKDNLMYGNFADGTARKLVVTNDDHLTELMSGAILRQSVDWIKQSAGIPVAATQTTPFLMTRVLGLLVLGIGVLLVVLGALSLTRKRLFPEGGELVVEPAFDEAAGSRRYLDVLLYAIPVVAASLLAMPAAKLFGVTSVAPYVVVNETGTFNLLRTILLLPLLIVLLVLVARRAAAAGRLQEKVKQGAGRWARSVAYALIPVALTILLLVAIGGPLILPRVFPMLPLYFIVGIVVVGGAFWLEDYLFYKLAYRALETDGGQGRQWRVLFVRAIVLDLVLICAMVPLMSGLGVSIHVFKLGIPVVMVLALTFPVLLAMSEMSIRLRSFTGGSLAFGLMLSSLLAWAMTTIVGVRGY